MSRTSSDARLRDPVTRADPVRLALERARAGLCRGCGRPDHRPASSLVEMRGEPGIHVEAFWIGPVGRGLFGPCHEPDELGWEWVPSVWARLYAIDPCGRIAGLQPATLADDRDELRARHAALWGPPNPPGQAEPTQE